MHTFLNMQLPPPLSRLRLPIMVTPGKRALMCCEDPLALFLAEMCVVPSATDISSLRLCSAYNAWVATVNSEMFPGIRLLTEKELKSALLSRKCGITHGGDNKKVLDKGDGKPASRCSYFTGVELKGGAA